MGPERPEIDKQVKNNDIKPIKQKIRQRKIKNNVPDISSITARTEYIKIKKKRLMSGLLL